MKTEDSFLVGVDFSHGKDVGILIVGRKKSGEAIEIINAFQGKEAEELYKKLITPKPQRSSFAKDGENDGR